MFVESLEKVFFRFYEIQLIHSEIDVICTVCRIKQFICIDVVITMIAHFAIELQNLYACLGSQTNFALLVHGQSCHLPFRFLYK